MGEEETKNVVIGGSTEETTTPSAAEPQVPAPAEPPKDVAEEKSMIPPSPEEKPDETKALAVVEKVIDPPTGKSSGGSGSADRDAVLARVETEKKMSLIKAWEDNEKVKIENKAIKKMADILAWENSKKAAIEAELKTMELSEHCCKNELEKVCGEGHATGEWAKSGNSETSFGTQHISLDEDECPSLMEIYLDASQPVDSPDVDLTPDSIEKTKQSIPSSSKGFTKHKKSKKNESDQSLHNYIVMMADSIIQVANAIQSSTRDFKERQMFNELMTELSSIPGFSAEEIDTIYENLSNNPTMIRSFLARPKESKARWMQKELGR